MSGHAILLCILLGLAVLLAIISALGLAVMAEALQRLHYSAIIVSWCALLIAIAVWVDEKDPQARIKVILVGVLLFTMNSVLTSATAKAIRVRRQGHWEPHVDEGIDVAGQKQPAGRYGREEELRA